jgi:glutathione S-transferase
MTNLTLYWGSGSAPSWRALLTLEIKKLPYESRRLEFSQREHKSPEMLAMNPRGRVPVLKDGDFSVYESIAVLAYLDRKYPQVPLLGTTPEETGLVWRHISECILDFQPALDPVRRPFFGGTSAEHADAIRAGAPKLHEELGRLEAGLKHEFLAGPSITGADVAYIPVFGYLQRAMSKPEAKAFDLGFWPLAGRYPKLGAWWARVEAMPEFQKTFPPHWR